MVEGRALDQLEIAETSSQGSVGATDLARRPLLRRGELLEAVPGVIITQHSGDGKANQYFLRGFNLDHGTDFATSVDGLPVNLRTHGHGQGYSDLNFLIPELVQRVDFGKGPFLAEAGDFSAAGSAHFRLVTDLPRGLASVTVGQDRFFRLLLADSWRAGPGRDGRLTAAFEAGYYDGPFTLAQSSKRYNLFLRYHWGDQRDHFMLTLMGYRGSFRSPDQVPSRAIESGLIPRLGVIDPTDGGASSRASVSFDWTRTEPGGAVWRFNAYSFHYRLDLFSNFTYFLDDPERGDQFHQADRRVVSGLALTRTSEDRWFGRPGSQTLGLQVRYDYIPKVALYRTQARNQLQTVREDRVHELSAGVFLRSEIRWTPWFRSVFGLRGDAYYFNVASDLAANSGTRAAFIASPKLSLVFGPWRQTEFYLNAGTGFHSNDARGTTIRVNPTDGSAAERVTPLVRSHSFEAGVRTSFLPGLVSTFSAYYLALDSELLFVGDAGNTEPSNATRRWGFEWTNFYKPAPWITLDADFAYTRARFSDTTGLPGNRIPGSIATVVAAGVTLEPTGQRGLYGTLRARYFGPAPITEDNAFKQRSSITLNARLGYRWRNWEAAVDCLNLLDRRNDDIAYFYTSRLPGEPAGGIDDVHRHPAEPRTFRFTVSRRY
ncbi:MAG: TonB-dependent receptor plug domain-containing protein [Verrucomicrobia bacterium]|nr:TonB-dependent receptor plug domain-containing protein [Verrucomicrobiota bacterium]